MASPYRDMPTGPSENVPLSVYAPFYPGQEPTWIPLVTGQRRLVLQQELEENRATERRAMKKYRAWRQVIYARSLAAIRLLDLQYLPMVEHPYRPGEVTYDLELPLRDRGGDEALIAHASNVEELEQVIRHWFAALTLPKRAEDFPETTGDPYAAAHKLNAAIESIAERDGISYGEAHAKAQHEFPALFAAYNEEARIRRPRFNPSDQVERVRVAEHFVHRAFHDDIPLGQRAALIATIFRCKWFDIPERRLRRYFEAVMRGAASREGRVSPLAPGGVPALSLDEPDPANPGRTRAESLSAASPEDVVDEAALDDWRKSLWIFMLQIPPSRPKLRRMASLVLECGDEHEAVERYGRGGKPQLKRLIREVRDWQSSGRTAT